jgi:predicted permease
MGQPFDPGAAPVMLAVILALAPIFALILLGQGLKRFRFVSDAFWPAAEKLTYFVTFPALLVGNLARADLRSLSWYGIAGSVMAATLLSGFAVLVLERSLLKADSLPMGRATASSVFQGSVRPNTYVALAAAAALFGPSGTTITAICIAATVPLVNVMAVSALTHMIPTGRSVGITSVLWGIVKNPLIIACTLGIGLNILSWSLPPVLEPLLDILGRAALPIGLLAVGAGLSLKIYPSPEATTRPKLRHVLTPLLCSAVLKLLFLPLLTGFLLLLISLIAPLFGGTSLDGVTFGTVVLWAGLPCAASAYVLARQMGGDAAMMAAIITWQTLAAMLTLPLLIGALYALKLL